MARLSSLLGSKSDIQVMKESNLEPGEVTVYSGNYTGQNVYPNCFCHRFPGNGTATIELWGPGGTTASVCCCGTTLPGNSGAYGKLSISVCACSLIRGCVGASGNITAVCCGNQGAPTYLCYCGIDSLTGCVCAQAGYAGRGVCVDNVSTYCCFVAYGMCHTNLDTCCGIVCNLDTNVQAGAPRTICDENDLLLVCCSSLISCGMFLCQGRNPCYMHYYHAVPPGVISKDGTYLVYQGACNSQYNPSAEGTFYPSFQQALNSAHRQPGNTIPWHMACWGSGSFCSCYGGSNCHDYVPVGTGGFPAEVYAGVIHYGWRGGHGAVRITYVAD